MGILCNNREKILNGLINSNKDIKLATYDTMMLVNFTYFVRVTEKWDNFDTGHHKQPENYFRYHR